MFTRDEKLGSHRRLWRRRLRRRRRPRTSEERQEAQEEGGARETRGEAEEAAGGGQGQGARGRKAEEAAEPLLPVLPGSEEEGGGRAPSGAQRGAQQEGVDQSSGREVESAANRGTEGQSL